MANKNTKSKSNNNKNTQNNKQNNVKKETKKVAPTKKAEAKKVETKKVVPTKKAEAKKENQKDIVKKVEAKEEVKKETVKVEEKISNTKEKKGFSLTSKQKDIILILLVAVLLVVALIVTSNKTPKLDIELPIAVEGAAGFNEITYSEYEEKLNTEAPFLVVIIKDGCGYCEAYEPILEEVATEYNIPINYINLSHLSEEDYYALSESNTYLKKNNWGTPTTLFMYGKDVVDSIGGYVEKDTLVEFIKENIKVD